MYYSINNDTINPVDEEEFYNMNDTIWVATLEEWNESKARQIFDISQVVEKMHFCKMESHSTYLYGTFRIPDGNDGKDVKKFALYILEERIIFIDNTTAVNEKINELKGSRLRKGYTLERFLYDFLVSFFNDDLMMLENLERKISKLEEDMLHGSMSEFNSRMILLKKEIARLYRYYSQMTEVGQELVDNEEDFFGREELKNFSMFKERASRLAEETQILREYAMQVQDEYQSEIGIRQNDVMKILTIVTAIFLPLTLIVGWYGMNFKYMPELSWKYGYPIVFAASVMVVVVLLIIFKKKKFW